MSTQQNPQENWEARKGQIEKEESYKKLSPADQAKKLIEEQRKFDEEKKKLSAELGYKKFDPATKKTDLSTAEEKEKEAELKAAEMLLEEKSTDKKSPPAGSAVKEKSEDFKNPETLKKFLALYSQCMENIAKEKPFSFSSMALNGSGQEINQTALLKKLVDHSQKDEKDPSAIYSRLHSGKTSPENIGLTIEIGNVPDNSLNLKDIQLEIPLAALLNGTFEQHLKHFTNYVLFAMLLYEKQKKALTPKIEEPKTELSKSAIVTPGKENPINPYKGTALTSIQSGGNLDNARAGLTLGDTSTVTFACNNGSVWGAFDHHRAPQNPKELQESLDKINQEK